MDHHDQNDSDHDLLVRIDERTKAFAISMGSFVTKKEFQPVKAIVYGFVTISLLAVVGALIKLVVIPH